MTAIYYDGYNFITGLTFQTVWLVMTKGIASRGLITPSSYRIMNFGNQSSGLQMASEVSSEAIFELCGLDLLCVPGFKASQKMTLPQLGLWSVAPCKSLPPPPILLLLPCSTPSRRRRRGRSRALSTPPSPPPPPPPPPRGRRSPDSHATALRLTWHPQITGCYSIGIVNRHSFCLCQKWGNVHWQIPIQTAVRYILSTNRESQIHVDPIFLALTVDLLSVRSQNANIKGLMGDGVDWVPVMIKFLPHTFFQYVLEYVYYAVVEVSYTTDYIRQDIGSISENGSLGITISDP